MSNRQAQWFQVLLGRHVVLATMMLAIVSCGGESPVDNPERTASHAGSAEPPNPTPKLSPRKLPPLSGLPWYMILPSKPEKKDTITLPLGAEERRPIVVAVHGGGDRPEWACGLWRIGVESYPFVVCPTGPTTGGTKFAWGTGRDIATAVARAVSEAERQFPTYVISNTPMIYAGFSQGATLAGDFLIEHAQQFPVVVLAEGGYDYLRDPTFARRFRAAGGRRVFILCGTPGCMITAKRAVVILERAGLDAMTAGDPTAGHAFSASMQKILRAEWQRLVRDVPGWETFSEHRWPMP
jgi:predicted esterase